MFFYLVVLIPKVKKREFEGKKSLMEEILGFFVGGGGGGYVF